MPEKKMQKKRLKDRLRKAAQQSGWRLPQLGKKTDVDFELLSIHYAFNASPVTHAADRRAGMSFQGGVNEIRHFRRSRGRLN